ncbi:hypothetical protein [Streptomyces sp. NPDC093223]|uniref:hypothetical protein n=1 Tax=Streptomyces sp. NPDC093223 TaxID=3366033 RepID=UPI0037FE9C9B
MQDTTEETTGERLTRTLEAHGLTVRTLSPHHFDERRIVVEVQGGAEILIADSYGQIDGWSNDHSGWTAFYRPHGERSDEGETPVYESEGTKPPFAQDTAALVAAVVQCAAARSRV